jgi:hypothetical protein
MKVNIEWNEIRAQALRSVIPCEYGTSRMYSTTHVLWLSVFKWRKLSNGQDICAS